MTGRIYPVIPAPLAIAFDQAACSLHPDQDWWTSSDPWMQAAAARVCLHDCLALAACQAHSATHRPSDGVWAGHVRWDKPGGPYPAGVHVPAQRGDECAVCGVDIRGQHRTYCGEACAAVAKRRQEKARARAGGGL